MTFVMTNNFMTIGIHSCLDPQKFPCVIRVFELGIINRTILKFSTSEIIQENFGKLLPKH